MKRILFTTSLAWLLILTGCQQNERDYYQIRIYSIDSAAQESRLDTYLANALIPALHRQGIGSVGVFKPVASEPGDSYVMVFIPFETLEQFAAVEERLASDESYQREGKEYIQAAHDDPPYLRIESTLLRAFGGHPRFHTPELNAPKEKRIYELRSYEAATELLYQRKVEMFNEGESDLFVELGFQPVFFGEVISGCHMPNLMYMTTFSDTVSQEEHWQAFREHPDWLEMKDLPRFQHTVSHITRYLMVPAAYSDI